jgi:hypothetical protein
VTLTASRNRIWRSGGVHRPSEVFERPNGNITLPPFVASPEFFAERSRRVWLAFEPGLEGLLPRSAGPG